MGEERIGVKRLRTGDHGSEDMISKLPDDIIFHILSTLSTEYVIPTGALSKRWKNLWKRMPELKFDKELHKHGFKNNILSALMSHENFSLRGLKISVEDECEQLDLAIWTSIVCARKVHKLVLILNNVVDPPTFPASILGHPNTLQILKLVGNLKLNIPSGCVALKSLKELHLYHSRFEDAESLAHLLSGCPNLEELVVDLFIESGVNIFMIAMQSLQRLTLGSYQCQEELFVIETPSLKYLNIRSFSGVSSCTIGNIAEVDEVKIADHDDDMDEDILRSITSAKFLSLSSPMKFPEGKIFWRLTRLELSTYGWNWCNLLSCIINSSPSLHILKLIGGFFSRLSQTWHEPVDVPSCFVNFLDTLEWTKYIWDGEDDKDVATYILKHAVHLKRAIFITSVPDNIDLIAQRNLRMRQLAVVATASPSCHLMFIDRAFDEYTESVDKDSDLGTFLN